MASIPLPALDVRPPAAEPNLLGQYAQLQALKNQQTLAPLQQQDAQLRVQSGQLDLQQRQQDLKDQQGISNWFMNIDPKDPNAFDPAAVGKTLAQSGVSGKGIMATQQQLLQHQQTALTMTRDQISNQQEMANQIYQGVNGIIGVTDPQARAQALTQLIPTAVQAKALTPQQAQQMMQNPAAVTDDQLKQFQHGLGVSSAFLASVARMQTAQTGEQTAAIKAPGEQAASDSLVLRNAAQQLAASPDQATYQAALGELPMRIAKNFPAQFDQQKVLQVGMTPAEVVTSQATAAQRQENNSFRQQALNLESQHNQNTPLDPTGGAIDSGATGQAVLDSMKPGDRGIVQAIIDGRQSPPSSFAQKTPYWQGMMRAVNAADPQWSEQRAQVRKAFTTGTDGRNIGALNTAAVHLDALQQAASALGNGSFQPGNQVFQYVQTKLGATPPTNFEGIKSAVSGEMAQALKGNATDIEIKNIAAGIDKQNSPQQLAGYINSQMGILSQKLQTYDQRYHQQIPGDTNWSPILPAARQALQRHGIQTQQTTPASIAQQQPNPGMIRALDPQGVLHEAPAGTPLPAGWKAQ